MFTEQAVEPLHAPNHERKCQPAAGLPLRCTAVPIRKSWEHVGGQLIPAGVDRTTPCPLVDTVNASTFGAKFACAHRCAVIVM
jgi:hypothetical protein